MPAQCIGPDFFSSNGILCFLLYKRDPVILNLQGSTPIFLMSPNNSPTAMTWVAKKFAECRGIVETCRQFTQLWLLIPWNDDFEYLRPGAERFEDFPDLSICLPSWSAFLQALGSGNIAQWLKIGCKSIWAFAAKSDWICGRERQGLRAVSVHLQALGICSYLAFSHWHCGRSC